MVEPKRTPISFYLVVGMSTGSIGYYSGDFHAGYILKSKALTRRNELNRVSLKSKETKAQKIQKEPMKSRADRAMSAIASIVQIVNSINAFSARL